MHILLEYKKQLLEGRVEAESQKVSKNWSNADGQSEVKTISDNKDRRILPFKEFEHSG